MNLKASEIHRRLSAIGPKKNGPVAIVFAEDEIGLAETLAHNVKLGFENLVVVSPIALMGAYGEISIIQIETKDANATRDAMNLIAQFYFDRWVFFCHNAEFLYFPFCETRTIHDFVGFLEEERRHAAFGAIIDLYPADLTAHPNGFDLATAHLDASGYYAMDRPNKDRQIEVYGGLRWRYEEYVPWERRRIDRIPLIKSQTGLEWIDDMSVNIDESNTYAAPWHHSSTVTLCSFRAAKYLRTNPEPARNIDSFIWGRSVPFDQSSEQLMRLGFMEPGQWF